ncbi:MAG TPA: aldehyde dehydrogenase family protein, partial [Pilimelia sp.]|nr:aldehyde dehydrogenase family protein [Pilimelia sp.]
MSTVEHYLDGGWSAGADHLEVRDPADDTLVTRAPRATAADVEAAVKSARAAAGRWAATPAAARGAVLHRIADALAERADALAALTTAEMGKPLADARGGVAAGIGTLRQYAELGPVHRGRSLAGDPGAVDLLRYGPRGVAAVITPWNDPVAVSCGLLGAAVVTGNCAIYKPSERAPGTGAALGAVFAAHLPAGVFAMLHGDGATGALLAAAEVDVVAHVGASATGRQVAEAAVRTGAKVLRENGGSDPLIVDAGVDPAWAAKQAALGAFANAGQICVAVERIYVDASLAAPFTEALVAEANAHRMGPGRDPGTTLGPLVDRRHREHVHAQVTEALAAGAAARCGGRVPEGPGAFYPATVLTDCTDAMAVVREETFGPVAPVVVVRSFAEALSRAADSPYGLAATVLTADLAHATRAADELPVGTVKVNDVFGGAPGGCAHPRR